MTSENWSRLVSFCLFTACAIEAQTYTHEYLKPALNFREGKPRVLIQPFAGVSAGLTGLHDPTLNARLVKAIMDDIEQSAPGKYVLMGRSVEIDYDENLQKTRDKLLENVIGVPYQFTKEELAAFEDIDAILFVTAHLQMNDVPGSKEVKASVRMAIYKDGRKVLQAPVKKKMSVDGTWRYGESSYHAVLLDPSSALLYAQVQGTDRKELFRANRIHSMADREVKIDAEYLEPMPPKHQTESEIIRATARVVSGAIAGERVVVELKWDKDGDKRVKAAWSSLKGGDLAASEAHLRDRLMYLLGNEDARREKSGSDKPMKRVCNNLGMVLELQGDLDAALEFRRQVLEVYRDKGGSDEARRAIARINDYKAQLATISEQPALWEQRRSEARGKLKTE